MFGRNRWQPPAGELLFTPGTNVRNLNGRRWFEVDAPPRRHTCYVQSETLIGVNLYERCACGARRLNRRNWFDKNTREKS